jgi:hypothetical protein
VTRDNFQSPRPGDPGQPHAGRFASLDALLSPSYMAEAAPDEGIRFEPAWEVSIVYGMPCAIYHQLLAATIPPPGSTMISNPRAAGCYWIMPLYPCYGIRQFSPCEGYSAPQKAPEVHLRRMPRVWLLDGLSREIMVFLRQLAFLTLVNDPGHAQRRYPQQRGSPRRLHRANSIKSVKSAVSLSIPTSLLLYQISWLHAACRSKANPKALRRLTTSLYRKPASRPTLGTYNQWIVE